jgi:enoyl-CoA hydratase
MATKLEYTQSNHAAYITFAEENEKAPCTLDHAVLDQFAGLIDRVANERDRIRVLIIQSRSPKFFVVGANIKALQQLTPNNIADWVKKGHRVFNMLQELPIPVIARVEGYALGGGLELAMACDMIFAIDKARFGQPEVTLGVVPGWGGSYRLPRLVGAAKAKELFFTGKIITAQEALTLGIVNQVVAADQMDTLLLETIASIVKNDAAAITSVKQLINNDYHGTLSRNCHDEAVASVVCLHSLATQQRLNAFFAARK